MKSFLACGMGWLRGVEHHHGKLEESTPRKSWTVRAPSDPCWGRRLDHEQVLRWLEAFRNTLENNRERMPLAARRCRRLKGVPYPAAQPAAAYDRRSVGTEIGMFGARTTGENLSVPMGTGNLWK